MTQVNDEARADGMRQCPKCKRWQSRKWGVCLSEFDTGIPCDGKPPLPAAPAGAAEAGDARRVVEALTETIREAASSCDSGTFRMPPDVARYIAENIVARRLLDAETGVGERPAPPRMDGNDVTRWSSRDWRRWLEQSTFGFGILRTC
jgi:hypothetical protein